MSKKQKYINHLIKILYKAQVDNNMDYPEKEVNTLENKIGPNALNEIINYLRDMGWTKIGSTVGMTGEVISISVGRPFLTIEAVEYAEYLLKTPIERFFIDLKPKKINWTVVGLVLTGLGLILNALINLDKLEANYNLYLKSKFLGQIQTTKISAYKSVEKK